MRRHDSYFHRFVHEGCRTVKVPERYLFEEAPPPDINALRAQAGKELDTWEAEHGPLPPMTLDDVPPVFGLAGYGPPDEG